MSPSTTSNPFIDQVSFISNKGQVTVGPQYYAQNNVKLNITEETRSTNPTNPQCYEPTDDQFTLVSGDPRTWSIQTFSRLDHQAGRFDGMNYDLVWKGSSETMYWVAAPSPEGETVQFTPQYSESDYGPNVVNGIDWTNSLNDDDNGCYDFPSWVSRSNFSIMVYSTTGDVNFTAPQGSGINLHSGDRVTS
jgi:hypothetical protein